MPFKLHGDHHDLGLVGGLSYQEAGGDIKTYTYTYAGDELPTKSTHPDGSTTAWTYDVLRRSTQTVFTPKSGAAAAKKLYTTFAYRKAGHVIDGTSRITATGLVSTYTNKFGSSGSAVSKFDYTYDTWGNIAGITDLAGNERTYEYNDNNEVTKAVETYNNGSTSTYTYTYDAGGNILTETINGKVNTYGYDSVWKDKLISYNGKSITYDEAGHPTNYMGSTMTWDANDRLTSIKGKTANGAASNITYTYLSDGSRRSKTVDGVTTTYHYNNGLLLSQTTGDETLYFYYDSTGKVVSIGYQKGSAEEVGYFFTRNAQGDIVGVYRSSDSKLIGTYEYDLWGKPVSTTEASAGIDTNGILTKNPFRYRGYYFDNETGFYYLNARYYDSEVRRFISADCVIASVGTTVEGYNLFGYGFNNPVNMSDEGGYWPRWITGAVAVGGLAVAAGAAILSAPVVAIVAAAVSIVFSISYAVQCWHYDERKAKNVNVPQSESEAVSAGWHGPRGRFPGPAADFHQYTAESGPNSKYVTPDGHGEVIYNNEGEKVTDSRDVGTYNFCPSGTFWGDIGHFFFDIYPWILYGNDDDDPGPLVNEIMKRIEE